MRTFHLAESSGLVRSSEAAPIPISYTLVLLWTTGAQSWAVPSRLATNHFVQGETTFNDHASLDREGDFRTYQLPCSQEIPRVSQSTQVGTLWSGFIKHGWLENPL